MTAEERRADVLRVAVHEFARTGFQGTSTEDVARAAGISQPYLFKMFPTKKALFIALIEQGRHHGYYDSDPAQRDAESTKTYNRFLQRFRGRKELLAPRT